MKKFSFLIAIVFSLSACGDIESAIEPKITKRGARNLALDAVRANFHSPDQVEFRGIRYIEAGEAGVACGEVRTKKI